MAAMERRCILTRQTAPKQSLIRFVLAPDGSVVADLAAKLPGRGASVVPDRKVIEKAIAKGQLHAAFSRAFECSVGVDQLPDGLCDRLYAGLLRRCQDRLGQAKRSGDCVSGFDKIKAGLAKGFEPGLLLSASDAGADGADKMAAFVGAEVPIDRTLDREALSVALGTDNSVHVIVRQGRNADLLAVELTRLSGMQSRDA